MALYLARDTTPDAGVNADASRVRRYSKRCSGTVSKRAFAFEVSVVRTIECIGYDNAFGSGAMGSCATGKKYVIEKGIRNGAAKIDIDVEVIGIR